MTFMDPLSSTAEETTEETRISALVTLLADDDPDVGDTISQHLRDIGPAALPALKEALGGIDPLLNERAERLVQELQQEEVIEEIARFGRDGATNLEAGLLLIGRLHTPDLKPGPSIERLNRMSEDLMLRLDPGDGVDRLLARLARYLHEEQGFSGNTDDYQNPSNSYLHTLLETRNGIPISLSCLYLLLGQRLALPLSGLGMPGHFLIKYDDGHDMRIIDPFHRGRTLDRDGCGDLLRGLGVAFDERYLDPVPTRYILERTLNNLISVFTEHKRSHTARLHRRALDALRGAP